MLSQSCFSSHVVNIDLLYEMATQKHEERKFILECIRLYQSLPALWNTKNSDYFNRIIKNEQYERLLLKYREKYPNADRVQLVKKFNSLRTNFRKEWKRIKDSGKSDAGIEVIEPTLWYFDEMRFLLDQEEPNRPHSTLPIEDIKEESEDFIDDLDYIGTNNTLTINYENVLPKQMVRRLDEGDELMSQARHNFELAQTDYDKIAAAWAVELQKMTHQQQLFAKKAINDILFEGQMGTLHRNSVKINSPTGTCTLYHSM